MLSGTQVRVKRRRVFSCDDQEKEKENVNSNVSETQKTVNSKLLVPVKSSQSRMQPTTSLVSCSTASMSAKKPKIRVKLSQMGLCKGKIRAKRN